MKNKIAVCFSGTLRTGVHAFPNIKQYYGDYFNNIDFFMHTWDIEDWGCDWSGYHHPFIGDSLWESYQERKLFKLQDSKLEKMESLYKFKKLETTSIFDSYDPNSPNKLQYMWKSFKRSIELKQEYEKENNFEYDIVVKSRPDILFRVKPISDVGLITAGGKKVGKEARFANFEKDLELIESDNIVAQNCNPCDGPNRTLDDVFWIGSNKVMHNLVDFNSDSKLGRNPGAPGWSQYLREITPWDPGESQYSWREGTYCDAKGVKFCELYSSYSNMGPGYCILRDHLIHLDPIEDFYKIMKEGY